METFSIIHLLQNHIVGVVWTDFLRVVHLQYHQTHQHAFTSTITGEPIFAQSYINAYNTAFNQLNRNYQKALYNYYDFTPNDTNSNFIPGTFGFKEEYNMLSQSPPFIIHPLQDDANVYVGTPYLFVSAGSGGGSGFMYLDWIIVTYGVPYVISAS